jgi:6-pyruvoyltetrahydropterin/6-carboxytetrahydropterin synthase
VRTQVTRTFTFDAAHQLPWHTGKCRNLHGHTYRLEVTVEGPLNEDGIVIDFSDLAKVVRSTITDRYDHRYLNDFFENPTAEMLALGFFKELEAEGLPLSQVTLWETPTSSATVEGERR